MQIPNRTKVELQFPSSLMTLHFHRSISWKTFILKNPYSELPFINVYLKMQIHSEYRDNT